VRLRNLPGQRLRNQRPLCPPYSCQSNPRTQQIRRMLHQRKAYGVCSPLCVELRGKIRCGYRLGSVFTCGCPWPSERVYNLHARRRWTAAMKRKQLRPCLACGMCQRGRGSGAAPLRAGHHNRPLQPRQPANVLRRSKSREPRLRNAETSPKGASAMQWRPPG
jgi:hypothetical protein